MGCTLSKEEIELIGGDKHLSRKNSPVGTLKFKANPVKKGRTETKTKNLSNKCPSRCCGSAPPTELIKEDTDQTLFFKLGGVPALKAAVDLFYELLVADEELNRFFKGVNLGMLKKHQYHFLTMAFTEFPPNMNVTKLLLIGHARLFEMGLNATHFDLVARHLVKTLETLGVEKYLIDEVVETVSPLREVFVRGSKMVTSEKQIDQGETKKTLLSRLGGGPALKGVVESFYTRLISDPVLQPFLEGADINLLKTHQYHFMTIIFTDIPKHMDIPDLILTKHSRLFEMGLNETHFDVAMDHMLAALVHVGAEQSNIEEATHVISKLRSVFVQGCIKAKLAQRMQT